jgi:pyruvate/2-oxoglutarate dehydrogenase complex dihydrolipoamide acyltransferase (E2) component
MALTLLRIPKAAVSMQTGSIGEWLVADGADVAEGQPIYCLEVDKTMLEVEAPASGRLTQKAVIGEEYAVGVVIGEILSA